MPKLSFTNGEKGRGVSSESTLSGSSTEPISGSKRHKHVDSKSYSLRKSSGSNTEPISESKRHSTSTSRSYLLRMSSTDDAKWRGVSPESTLTGSSTESISGSKRYSTSTSSPFLLRKSFGSNALFISVSKRHKHVDLEVFFPRCLLLTAKKGTESPRSRLFPDHARSLPWVKHGVNIRVQETWHVNLKVFFAEDPFRIILKQDARPVEQKPYRHSPVLAAKVPAEFTSQYFDLGGLAATPDDVFFRGGWREKRARAQRWIAGLASSVGEIPDGGRGSA